MGEGAFQPPLLVLQIHPALPRTSKLGFFAGSLVRHYMYLAQGPALGFVDTSFIP